MMPSRVLRSLTLAVAALAAISPIGTSVLAGSLDHPTVLRSLSKRDMEAREKLLASLPGDVVADLDRRDPSEYELNWDHYLPRDVDENDDEGLAKRQEGGGATGTGDQRCKSGYNAITYDDGPYLYQKELTDLYAKAGQHATYFINVQNWDCAYDAPFPENLQYAVKMGMTIGSHTATHPHLPQLSLKEIDKQVNLVNNFTWSTLGLIPLTLRPPYGETTEEINDHLRKQHGIHVVQWSLDAGDADGLSVDQTVKRIRKELHKGDILLNHETHASSIKKVAPRLLRIFKKRGLKSVGIGKCLGIKPYKVKLRKTPKRKPSWNCKKVPQPGQP